MDPYPPDPTPPLPTPDPFPPLPEPDPIPPIPGPDPFPPVPGPDPDPFPPLQPVTELSPAGAVGTHAGSSGSVLLGRRSRQAGRHRRPRRIGR